MESNRIKEDSFYDMQELIGAATEKQAYFIYNDPLVSPEHKSYLLERHPFVEMHINTHDYKVNYPIQTLLFILPVFLTACFGVYLLFRLTCHQKARNAGGVKYE